MTGATGGRVVSGTCTNVVNCPAESTGTLLSTIRRPISIVTALHGDMQNPEPVTLIVASGGPEAGSMTIPGAANAGAPDTRTIANAVATANRVLIATRSAPGSSGAERVVTRLYTGRGLLHRHDTCRGVVRRDRVGCRR